ncbi:hypothetical protein [Collimonas humicola]|uniref:hypothetical protein n=1 Tax=Collimonas humicola TaxID=2825886 RepID=UPI001B8CE655|nr:hypothetical protein [Collimonas humicola]
MNARSATHPAGRLGSVVAVMSADLSRQVLVSWVRNSLKKSDEIGAMRRCKYSQGDPPLLRFAPSLALISSLFLFNEPLTQDTRARRRF